MSTVKPLGLPEEAPAAPPRGRRRRAVVARPGWSLLAEGEPMVWLTGGALAICLCMIVGLVGLIVYRGLITFWPAALLQVELADGTVYLGEVTRRETYRLSRDALEAMPTAIAGQVRPLFEIEDRPRVSRRLLRTGNFELTSTHFHWISDFAIAPSGESRPEWAVVAERLSWGRFYGTPREFAIRHPRPPGEREQRLQRILTFFQASPYQLTDEQREELEPRLAEMETPLAELKDRLRAVRQNNVTAFLGQHAYPDSGAVRHDVVLDSGEAMPLAEAGASPNVVEFQEVSAGATAAWEGFRNHHGEIRRRFHQRERLQKHDLGRIDDRMNRARLDVRKVELDLDVAILAAAEELARLDSELEMFEQAKQDVGGSVDTVVQELGRETPLATVAIQLGEMLLRRIDEQMNRPQQRREQLEADLATAPDRAQRVVEHYRETLRQAHAENAVIQSQIDELRAENLRYELRMETVEGKHATLELDEIVRAYPANQLNLLGKLGVYFSRWGEFLTDEPRDSNNAGGVFPAIWGTVAMTLIMAILVVPFGVLAALYLREYARGGLITSVVRIAINNLAGVPSIVFGVFGFAFFSYAIGSYIDRGPRGADIVPWPPRIWFVALFVLAVVGTGAFVLGLSSLAAGRSRNALHRWLRRGSFALWIGCFLLAVLVIAKTPFFDGFFAAQAPIPKFGTGGLLWASLTLALLTLPVVIVATEEALSAVPNSLREGSYACGAGKWQTIRRIVLPHAMPGIMTGMILAMARGAGEVAPLMLVGAVKVAPDLPVDMNPPFIHLERSFMHLGFHIFDLGFQSQNSEASQPIMFTTTLLLLALIAMLNIAAIRMRSRLRRRFQASQF